MPAVVEPLSRFFGREREITAVCALIERAPVVTLTGAAGIGKTRLALRAASKSGREVVTCDLAKANDAAEVERALAQVPVGARLVLVDKAEHVAPHVAAFIRRAPREIAWLVTSRTLLHLGGEQAYVVPPLADDDAVALFADRARLSRHNWDADAEGDAVLTIVRKLDGVPLAIELAAARMAVMSAASLVAKLDDALGVLDRADHALRGAIETMCATLSASERAALGRLAVFRGAFDVEMASAILGAPAADAVQTLLERSLLRAAPRGRFALYEAVRQLARAELVTDAERADAMRAHDRLFVAHAERWLAPGPTQLGSDGLAALADEGDDLRFVHDRRVVLPVAIAWHSVLYARGELDQGREVLDAALEKCGDGEPRLVALALALRVLHQRARTTPLDAARARAECERARKLAAGDARIEALAASALAYVAVQTGDDAAITRLLPEAIEMQHACGDAEGEMRTRRLAGTILVNQGRGIEAMRHFEIARDIARRVAPESVAVYSAMIGMVHLGAGEVEQAERSLRDAVDRIGVDEHLEGAQFAAYLAVALQELGRFDEADALYRRAIETSRKRGDTRQLPITLHYWATLAHETGDLEAAIARYRDALSYYAGGTREIATCTFAGLAAALATAGRGSDAKAELANALHACRELGPVWKNVALVHGSQLETSPQVPAVSESNEDVRFALRLLARRVERASCALVVGRGGAWFSVREGPRVSLERRKLLRALLDALVTHPSLSSDALIAKLWPGERLARDAGLNRVRVAVAQLRALGLGDRVEHENGVYKLREGFRVED